MPSQRPAPRLRNSPPAAVGRAVLGLLLLAPAAALAVPRICGGNSGLGSFQPARCPELKDDGVAPDEKAGDGLYSVEVRLAAPVSSPLEYKLLPSGAFDGTELGSYRGSAGTDTCGLTGTGSNMFRNLQVPSPDDTRPVRFYYDTRAPLDTSYARPPGDRSFGDDLMVRSPGNACPGFVVVGDFQSVPFDRAVGAVTLVHERPGVLTGRWLATQALAAGWRWQVQEQAPGTRRFGPAGWSYEPCQGDRASVASAVRLGDTVTFTFYTALGRLRTTVQSGGGVDGGAVEGMQCPPPLRLDMSGPIFDDLGGGTPADGGARDAATGDQGVMRPLPGIHCDLSAGRSSGPGLGVGAVGLALGLLVSQRGRRRGAGTARPA